MDILILDETRADYLAVERHLARRDAAINCHWASDWASIEAALAAQRWAVILTDYTFPGIRFLDLLLLVQARQPDVPIILVSGSLGEETAVDLYRQGVWDFALKDNLGRLQTIMDRSLREASERVARRRAEASLRLVDAAMNASDRAVMITDVQGYVEWVNGAFTRLTGYALDDLHARNARLLRSGLEPNAVDTLRWTTLEEGRPWHGELINRRKDGSLYHDEMTITPVRDPSGILKNIVSVHQDVTERKAMEAALLQSQQALQAHKDHLEEVVASRTAEAERLSRVKSEFLANMSHEIRTPLNAMLGMAQVGWRQCKDTGDRRTFTRILDSGQHLVRVLDDILDFSKIDMGKLHLDSAPVDLPALLGAAADMFSESARARGLALEVDVDPALPRWILGDGLRLSQVVVNILSNAVKFTERGGVTLSADGASGNLELRVVDTGVGMTDAQVQRIFQPFEQADTSTTRRFGGSGLGLAITARLVELMGGSIAVISAPGAGSTFSITVPLTAAPVPVEAAEDAAVPRGRAARPQRGGRLKGVHILAAEDNETNRILLGEILRLEGAQLTLANDGAAACELVARHGEATFDVVLTDIQMPVMDGYGLARSLRTTAPTLPVIGLTAHAMEEERQRCLAAGMLSHVSKPIDLDALVATVLRYARAPRAADHQPASSA
jgi:PAS domain S-box-containing protein